MTPRLSGTVSQVEPISFGKEVTSFCFPQMASFSFFSANTASSAIIRFVMVIRSW
jgi:hypothetical protein